MRGDMSIYEMIINYDRSSQWYKGWLVTGKWEVQKLISIFDHRLPEMNGNGMWKETTNQQVLASW